MRLEVTTLCASRGDDGPGGDLDEALSEREHIAFKAVYTFSDFDSVEAFRPPPEATRCLK
ncbi:MAG: hypothetical protein D6731_03775 [Planctomycetota bacterium]|nr:MAG: hypothetical protein D6731_03775 [Planctomycetota bacterium]